MSEREYSPDRPYGVMGDHVRHDLLHMIVGRPSRVLSIGCGTCATEIRLREMGSEVWGLDVSSEAVQRAAPLIDRAICGDIETAALDEIPDRHFDAILCGDVLEHLRFTEHALRRIHGWLADSGQFIASVPNSAHYTVLRELAIRREWKYEDAGLFDRGHYRIFTRKSFVRTLEGGGFHVEALGRNRPLSPKLGRVFFAIRPMIALIPALDDYFVHQWITRARKSGISLLQAGK